MRGYRSSPNWKGIPKIISIILDGDTHVLPACLPDENSWPPAFKAGELAFETWMVCNEGELLKVIKDI